MHKVSSARVEAMRALKGFRAQVALCALCEQCFLLAVMGMRRGSHGEAERQRRAVCRPQRRPGHSPAGELVGRRRGKETCAQRWQDGCMDYSGSRRRRALWMAAGVLAWTRRGGLQGEAAIS